MKEIKLTFLAGSSFFSKELVDMLNRLFTDETIAEMKVEMKTIFDGDQADMTFAGLRDDIVIFDASIEDATGSNYKAAQMWPSCMEHFLVVSRTRIPLNFQPFHDGGTPETAGEQTNHPLVLDNYYLVKWIQEKLKLLEPQMPRPQDDRLDLQIDQLEANIDIFSKVSNKLISNSIKRRDLYRQTTGRSFISYLSKYYRSTKDNEPNVETLEKYIKDKHQDPNYPVLYFRPGEIASEFMTKQRRWQVLSIIDWRIRAVDEVWIFETDDYYDSWWTQAELASLAYIKYGYQNELSDYKLPRIFVCKPKGNDLDVREAEPDFIQEITPKNSRTFGRYLSNSDPLTMGYELVPAMRNLSNFPVPIQWISHQVVGLLMRAMRPLMPTYFDKYSSLFSFDRFREMISPQDSEDKQSGVFSESFWNDRIVICPCCKGRNIAKHNFDFKNFMLHKQTGQFLISPDEMGKIKESHLWQCEKCKFKFLVVEENNPQFIWWPVRANHPTGPNGVYIENIPTYRLQALS